MNDATPDLPADELESAPQSPGARFALASVLALALVLVLSRLLGGPPGIEQREESIAEIEKTLAAHTEDAGAVASLSKNAALARDWQDRLDRPVGHRSWRFGHRSTARTEPPTAPRNLRGSLSDTGETIVLQWDPVEDADEIIVLRSTRMGHGTTKVEGFSGAADTWEDKLRALSGAYTYALRSVRNGVESKGTSNSITVKFEVPYRMRVQSLDRNEEVAWIWVEPLPDGPRPPLFVTERFRVKLNEIVGTEARWFDYATGYVFRSVLPVEDTIFEEGPVPIFTPEGTRKRDGTGRPLFKIAKEERKISGFQILLKKDDAPDISLDVPR